MANKQPFYHRAVLLFTGLDVAYSPEDLATLLRLALKKHGTLSIVIESIEVEECDAEPGDPADLL